MVFAHIRSLGRRTALAVVVALFALALAAGSLAAARVTGKASVAGAEHGRATTHLAADSTGSSGGSCSCNVRKPR
jgi:hypothetical protein